MTTTDLWVTPPRIFRQWNNMNGEERRLLAAAATREYSKDIDYISDRMVEIEKEILNEGRDR